MKKIICAIIVVLGLVSNAENLLQNGNFEEIQTQKPYLPVEWGIHPKGNRFTKIDAKDAAVGKNSVKIDVPSGQEGIFLFNQAKKVKIPANVPLKLSGWFKSKKFRAVKGKKSESAIAVKLVFADGSNKYPVLSFHPGENNCPNKIYLSEIL